MFDYLIAGAGFAGSVVAAQMARLGRKVLIVDKRPHVAGNAFDHYDAAGVLVHKYGPHIFHTNSKDVFEFLSRFTEWRPYEHRVLAEVGGTLVPIPINIKTVNLLYGLTLQNGEMEAFLDAVVEHPPSLRTSEDVVLSRVGRDLYEKLFRGYTRKQWGLDPSELDACVTARIPVRNDFEERYFTDSYQVMPADGYTSMFEKMLDHPNITIELSTSYQDVGRSVHYRERGSTGPVD
jgi:UDP-galactopyranose mutase